jgi:(2Fe-2S) ferredoxin
MRTEQNTFISNIDDIKAFVQMHLDKEKNIEKALKKAMKK